MLTLILVIFVHAIAFVPGESSHMHVMHQQRRLADHTVDRQGYISIDCGSDEPLSYDGIDYVTDSAYIDTGINNKISPEISVSQFYYKTLRSFPDGIRNCYTLRPLNAKGNSYLIRAAFKYGNYDEKNSIPIFDVYIGVNFWWTLRLSDSNPTQFDEIIYKATEDDISLCLVNTGQGTPFISALFLRPLNNSIYHSPLGSLTMDSRFNTGSFGPGNSSYYESYPDDVYDLFWNPLSKKFANSWGNYSTRTDVTSIINDAYKVPPSIFKTGAQPLNGEPYLGFMHSTSYIRPTFYVYWHFLETQKLGVKDVREFQITLNGSLIGGPIRLKYLQSLTIVSYPITLGLEESQFNFYITQTNASTLPPILNAVEFYYVTKLPQSATNQDDVNAIMDIKKQYAPMKGWQGDPCLPASPWHGLECNNSFSSPRITSLNLSSMGLTGELLPSISSLSSLNYLYLSDNSLTGTIPEFLANMPSLQVIDLRGNNFTGLVPVKLTDKVKNGLLTLRLDDNPDLCISNACAKKSNKHKIMALIAGSASLFVLLIIVVAVYCAYRSNTKQGFTNGNKSERGMKSKKWQFTYSDVVTMTNNFQTIIGKGSFGTVYHGSLEDGSVVAVKILNHSSSSLILKSFQTEVDLLMRVHHRNLVSLVGYCDVGTTMALIYDYMANGNLQEQLSGEKAKILSWKERLQISIDAAQGLEYLHSGCKPAIVHRDMKTANILLDDKMQAKIADFGLSKIFASESATHISTEHVAGTPGYLDPEYHVSCRLNEKSDVYSFGIILLELITGQTAMIRRNIDMVHIISRVTPILARGEIHEIVDNRLNGDYDTNSAWKTLETAMACVPSSYHQRPTMSQVLIDLKECLAIELTSKKSIRWGEQKSASLSNPTFDCICFDSEADMGPSAR